MIAKPHIERPLSFQNGYRDDKWDLRMADGHWAEVLLVTPEILKVKNDLGDAADEVECQIAKLKYQGVVRRQLEDLRDRANTAVSSAYRKAWEVDSRNWYRASAAPGGNEVAP